MEEPAAALTEDPEPVPDKADREAPPPHPLSIDTVRSYFADLEQKQLDNPSSASATNGGLVVPQIPDLRNLHLCAVISFSLVID